LLVLKVYVSFTNIAEQRAIFNSERISFKKLLMSEVIQSEALVNLLERKGIITKKELLEEIKAVQSTLPRQ